MTNPMDDLRQVSADVSGVEVLSPAAQAVRKAYYSTDDDLAGPAIAAALRAAAEQIENRYCDTDESSLDDSPGIVFAMRQLVLIAAELEGATG